MTPDEDAGSLLLIRAELLTMRSTKELSGNMAMPGLRFFGIVPALQPAIPFGSYQFTMLISGGGPTSLVELHEWT